MSNERSPLEIIFTPAYQTDGMALLRHYSSFIWIPGAKMLPLNKYENHRKTFYHLNWLFNQMERTKQDELFALYARAEKLIRSSESMALVNDEIREIFKDLLNILNAEFITDWWVNKTGYSWPGPSDLPRTYSAAASPKYPEEKTYVLSEYQELFAFILQLRACLPIWAHYLTQYGRDISPTYRDMFLIGLLDDSNISESKAWKRLEVYIEAWLGNKEDIQSAAVLVGISVEQFPHWMLCQSAIRKLAQQPLDNPVEGDNSPFVVKHLSNHIGENIKKSQTVFGTPNIKPELRGEDSGHENDRSMYENNKVTESVARGERWTTQIYLEDPVRFAKSLEPDIDAGFVNRVLACFNMAEYVPSNNQMLIAMWVAAPVISVRSESDLTRANSVYVCAVATAVLWHRGHKDIGAFIACQEGQNNARINNQGGGVRYPAHVYQSFREIYPFFGETHPALNGIRDTINNCISESMAKLWSPQLPADLLAETEFFQSEHGQSVRITSALSAKLADAVIDLARRPVPENAWDKANRLAAEMGLPDHPTPWPVIKPVDRKI